MAVRNKRPSSVEKLLSLGADPVQMNGGSHESALDLASSDPAMQALFHGLVIPLPDGDMVTYEESKLRDIQAAIKHGGMEAQVQQSKQRVREADCANKNHLRARDHAHAKADQVRIECQEEDRLCAAADKDCAAMRKMRDLAVVECKLMQGHLEQLHAEKVHWDAVRRRSERARKERDVEVKRRAAAESQLGLAMAHIARLERQRDQEGQAAAAANKRTKDAIGSALATALSLRRQATLSNTAARVELVAAHRRLGPAGEIILHHVEEVEDEGGGLQGEGGCDTY
jgi:hypothetical protein